MRGGECRPRRRSRAAVSAVALALAVAATAAPAQALTARGSAEQVYVTGLDAGARATLVSPRGRTVATRRANSLGGMLFREVRPGSGYRVRARSGERSGPLTVISTRSAPPSTSVYDQAVPPSGYGYLTTRDGTRLSYYVHPPQDVTKALPGPNLPHVPLGPTPTLIEYSGYGYANPDGPESGISVIANLMGFTVVDVNMRGTGCSGGAFDFFEPLQGLDGYDVVETIARQPWVKHNKVGMMGISYGGISQLFTAQHNPPSLAAIAPFSVIDQTQTTLYPGGVLNTGFAVEWAKERQRHALPAGPNGGQAWAYKRIREGDQTCRQNQALHGEAVDLMRKIRENDHYVPRVADPLAPLTFVHKIRTPVFMACQWTDEQTGGHCPTLASRFTGTRKKWFTFTNGTHVDSLAPETFNRWYDFLQIYVGRRAPIGATPVMKAAAPIIYGEAMGINGVGLPPDRVQQQITLEAAQRIFEQQPPVRILFDNGAGSDPGHPLPGFERSFESIPAPGTVARRWYLAPGGTLTDTRPARAAADAFNSNPRARPPNDFSGNTAGGDNGLWTATPPYRWAQPPPGMAVSYVTAPLTSDTAVLGAGGVRLRIRATRPNVDLQATISEVRPDGKETFVQGGWLAAKARKLDRRKSGPLAPVLSLRRRDFAPVPHNRFTSAVIPLYYQGHVYRAGSRIRVTIGAPNGDQPIWAFGEAQPRRGRARVAISLSPRTPSSLVLPVVPGVDAPTALPPCPALRGQPCRPYRAFANRRTTP
jgi:predicted acyl esterase